MTDNCDERIEELEKAVDKLCRGMDEILSRQKFFLYDATTTSRASIRELRSEIKELRQEVGDA